MQFVWYCQKSLKVIWSFVFAFSDPWDLHNRWEKYRWRKYSRGKQQFSLLISLINNRVSVENRKTKKRIKRILSEGRRKKKADAALGSQNFNRAVSHWLLHWMNMGMKTGKKKNYVRHTEFTFDTPRGGSFHTEFLSVPSGHHPSSQHN